MVKQEIKIINETGLHLRPAGNLCKEALKYESRINIIFGTTTANAKSVLSVLGACIKYGDVVEFECTGRDENDALSAMIRLVEAKFGEEE